jgi:hypothetical protein
VESDPVEEREFLEEKSIFLFLRFFISPQNSEINREIQKNRRRGTSYP